MKARSTIVGLGEILWDVFPEGPQFGGAPANFACSAAELGGSTVDAFIVGSVGRDDLGTRAIELLESHGVRTDFVSPAEQPTGQVLVTLDATGRPSFEIAQDAAWDNLAWSETLAQLAARADAVCFGTLGQRGGIARDTIQRFVRATRPDCLRILDINLRPPFWSEDVVRQSLALANVLKLNDTELPTVADILGWQGSDHDLLERLLAQFSLRLVALTRGEQGAVLVSGTGEMSDLPAQPTTIADTVGAGDAYTAALAIGLLRDLPLAQTNAWAIRVAAFVCSQAGATPRLPEHLRGVSGPT